MNPRHATYLLVSDKTTIAPKAMSMVARANVAFFAAARNAANSAAAAAADKT